MANSIHEEATRLLLSAIDTQRGGDGLRSAFMFGRPGSPSRNIGTEIYFSRRQTVKAALYVRQNGSAYLRFLSVSDIMSMLRAFVTENFWYLQESIFSNRFAGSYDEHISEEAKANMTAALAAANIFSPKSEPTLFPLVPVRVEADFNSEPFFLVAPKSLGAILHDVDSARWLLAEQFPPIKDWKGIVEKPSAWLGVRSPVIQASTKMRSAILGALALTPLPRYRHRFSGRKTFGGFCTVGEKLTTAFGEAHTPPLMDDIVLTDKDHGWLSILAAKLASGQKEDRRQLHALEYYYRAWPLEQSERFPILCMTLDAVFGDANQATQAVIDGVRASIGQHVSEARLRLLMELRASVVHGGAPDIYDSRKYAKYYERYGDDPVFDLELVVARCLRTAIFGEALVEQADPNAQIIAEMQAKGRLPMQPHTSTILSEPESSTQIP